MKKARFLFLHPEANPGKVRALDDLLEAYTDYLRVCVNAMLTARRFSVALRDKQAFFPPCEGLSSQIVKNARDHAISMVSGWAASKYAVKLRGLIRSKHQEGVFDEDTRSALFILGKRLVDRPSGKVTQEALDLYWGWLLDPEVVGRPPHVSDRCGIRMSEMTAVLGTSEETNLTAWWLGFSHLGVGKPRIQLPLSGNPYIRKATDVSKGILARKDRHGRWRFEVVEKKDWAVPEPSEDGPRTGVDVGLNVMAATSDGRLLGASLKPKFDRAYSKLQSVRANRQRQGLQEDSKRLARLEAKLTGLIKTATGEVSNKLVAAYPQHTFVIEDLDLRGCRGQKRFAYRALHRALSVKASVKVVNPAYTSQTCPSCGYVSRKNRSGVRFHCHSCGREGHADVVGGKNLLGRSEDKQVQAVNHPSEVKALLRRRFLLWRTSPVRSCSDGARTVEPETYCEGTPSGRSHSLKPGRHSTLSNF